MGGCQSTSDEVDVPKRPSLLAENKFSNLEKHKFALPEQLKAKLELVSSNGKVTDYITRNSSPIVMSYQELDIGSSLDENHKYVDPHFKAQNQSLSSKPVPEHVEWVRPADFMKGSFGVFEGAIEPMDIKQGKLGDCYLLSALCAISEHPFIIKRIFQTTEESSYGAYGIWLFLDGIWTCVVLDDQFPIHNKKPLYSRNNGNQLWVMLIQKAYAKVFGSFEAIESGLTGIAMSTITGAPYEYICKDSSNKINAQTAWEFISGHTSQNHLLTGSTENNDRNQHMGLVSTHAYTILDCQEVHIGTKKGKRKERILKLSNPWGQYEWKGRWSESSDVWTEQLRKQLGFEKADDGIFWMNLEDFLENFGQICVCKFNKNYVNTSLPLTLNQQENDYKGVFLKVENRVQGYLNLIQKDHRHFPESDYEYSLVRLIVMQLDKGTKTLHRFISDTIDCDHDASIYIELDPGEYYVIVEVDWKCDLTRDIVLNFYGQQPIAMVQDPHPLDIQHLFNQIIILHEKHTEQERVYEYEKDAKIRRITGSLAGYVYYHYENKSKNNNYLCQSVTLKEKKHILVHGEERKDDFIVKVYPDEERIVRLKVQKEGNSYYSFSTKIQFYIVQKYSLDRLRQLADKKPTKSKKREIQNKEIDVVVKTYNYSGGIAILYQNKMEKYAYVEEITFDVDNLQLQNQTLPRSKKMEIELEPQSEKLLSFLVSSPGKEVVFKTKISFYLNSPQFKF